MMMTSTKSWDPSQVNLSETRREQKSEPPFCHIIQATSEARYEYICTKTDQALLHYTETSMVQLKELLTMKIPWHINEETWNDQDLEDDPARCTYVSTERDAKSTAEALEEQFCIGPEQAKATLWATTQRDTRSAILPINYRYIAERMFDIKQLSGKFCTDTIWSKTRSITNNVA